MPPARRFALLVLSTLLLGLDAAALDCRSLPDATPPKPDALQAAMRDARDHGFLWRIRKDGRSSYLYGTMHVGRLEWMFPGPRVMRALRDSDVLALELDPLDPDIQSRLAAGVAAMPHVALPEALQRRMRQAAEALCVPYDSIAGYSPEFQVVSLSAMAGRHERLEAQFGSDIGLAVIGHRSGMEVASLETPELQLLALQMHDPQETAAFVEDGLDELEPVRSAAMIGRMSRAWAESDADSLAHYPDWCQCLQTPIEKTMMKRLLDDRNPGLADAIDRLHRSGQRVFAATGSLHLFGPTGLPALLEGRGYHVERIDLTVR
jgi:uncharacterized protein YbaP (TraB family)